MIFAARKSTVPIFKADGEVQYGLRRDKTKLAKLIIEQSQWWRVEERNKAEVKDYDMGKGLGGK